MKQEGSSYDKLCKRQVAWYHAHGKYPERIRFDRDGTAYVIGDWSWNKQHPDCFELVDERLPVLPV